MSFLWWLISLAIAGAIIYYLVMARPVEDDTVGVDRAATVNGGAVEEEFAEELAEGRREDRLDDRHEGRFEERVVDRPDEPLNPTLAQLYSDEAIDASPMVNLDTAAAIASRGAGGIDDEDEEYGADLDNYGHDENGDEEHDHDHDDDDIDDDTTTYTMSHAQADRLEGETYMAADDVKRETESDRKKGKAKKHRKRR